MIELQLLAGDEAGVVVAVARFPFSVGRSDSDLRLAAPGVWEKHFSLTRSDEGLFLLVPSAEAPISVGGQHVTRPLPLRNGDWIDCGAARLQFRVSPARQKGLMGRERTTWGIMIGVLLVQLWYVLVWNP
jgi:hypothetical protein